MAVTAALESAQAFDTNCEAISLSSQQVMDCTSDFERNYGNTGCAGGYLEQTIRYVKERTIYDESTIPYKGENRLCNDERKNRNAKQMDNSYTLLDMKEIGTNSPSDLRNALNDGPVLATIRAGNPVFRNYAKGVIDDSVDCFSKYDKYNQHDHAVLVVGYGKAVHGGNYFVIKNSWSKQWGSKGFAKIAADTAETPDGVCGILSSLWQPTYV